MANYTENLFAKTKFNSEMVDQLAAEIKRNLQKRKEYIALKRKLSKYVGKEDTFVPEELGILITKIDEYNKTGDKSLEEELKNYKQNYRIHVVSQNMPKLEKQIALANKNLITIFNYLTNRKEIIVKAIDELKKVSGKKRLPKYIPNNRTNYVKISSKIEHQYSNLIKELDSIDKLISSYDESLIKKYSAYLEKKKQPSYTIDEAYVNSLETLEEKATYYENLAEKISKVEVKEKNKGLFEKEGYKPLDLNKKDLPIFEKCLEEYEKIQLLIEEKKQAEQRKKEALEKRTKFRIDLKKVRELSLEERADYFTDIAKQILKAAQTNPNYPKSVPVGKNKYYTVNIEDVNIFKQCFFQLKETLGQMMPKPSYTIDEAYVNSLETLEEKKAYYENLAEKIYEVKVREKDIEPFTIPGYKKARYFNKEDLPIFQKCFDEYERLDALIKEQMKQQEIEEQKRIENEKQETNQIKILSLPIDFAYVSTLDLKERIDYFDHQILTLLNEEVEDKEPIEVEGISCKVSKKSQALFEFCYKEYKKAYELLKLQENKELEKELEANNYTYRFAQPSDAEYKNKFLDSLLDNICTKPIREGNQRTHYKGNKCYKYDIKYSKLVEAIFTYYDICRRENATIAYLKNATIKTALRAAVFAGTIGLSYVGLSSAIEKITQPNVVNAEAKQDLDVDQTLYTLSNNDLNSENALEVQNLEPTVSQDSVDANSIPEVKDINQELIALSTEDITYSIVPSETEIQPENEEISISENSVSQNNNFEAFLTDKTENTVSQDSILEQKDDLESVSQDSIAKDTDKVENAFLQSSVSENSISKNEIPDDTVSNNSLNNNVNNNISKDITSSITNSGTFIGNDELFDQMIADMEEIVAEKRRQEALDLARIDKYEGFLQEYCYYFDLDSAVVIDLAAKVSDNYKDFSSVIDTNHYDVSDPEKTCMYFTYLLYMEPESLKFRLANFGYDPNDLKLDIKKKNEDHLAELVCKLYNITLEQYKVVKATIRHEAGSNYNEMINVASCVANRIKSPAYASNPYNVITSPGQFSSYLDGYYKAYLDGYYLTDLELNAEINKEIDMIFLGMINSKHNYLSFRSPGSGYGIQLTPSGNEYGHSM